MSSIRVREGAGHQVLLQQTLQYRLVSFSTRATVWATPLELLKKTAVQFMRAADPQDELSALAMLVAIVMPTDLLLEFDAPPEIVVLRTTDTERYWNS